MFAIAARSKRVLDVGGCGIGPMTARLSQTLTTLLLGKRPAILLRLVKTEGSSPRDVGAEMLVTSEHAFGTIGGGALEWAAMETARCVLGNGDRRLEISQVLGPEIGQCCGGRVRIFVERADEETLADLRRREAAELATQPLVTIYGAGHVGRALALSLEALPFRTRIVDERPSELEAVLGTKIERVLGSTVAAAANAPPGAAHVVVTHSHSLDSLVCVNLLEYGDFQYLGLIGSKTKREFFFRCFRDVGIPQGQIERVVCPIGGKIVSDKRPNVIAALVAVELLEHFLK